MLFLFIYEKIKKINIRLKLFFILQLKNIYFEAFFWLKKI
jgi:hypothetical protein